MSGKITEDSLKELKYRDLQKLCKEHGVKASGKAADLLKSLTNHLKLTENTEPAPAQENEAETLDTEEAREVTVEATNETTVVVEAVKEEASSPNEVLNIEEISVDVTAAEGENGNVSTPVKDTAVRRSSPRLQAQVVQDLAKEDKENTFAIPSAKIHKEEIARIKESKGPNTPRSMRARREEILVQRRQSRTREVNAKMQEKLAELKGESEKIKNKPRTPKKGLTKDWDKIHEQGFAKMKSITDLKFGAKPSSTKPEVNSKAPVSRLQAPKVTAKSLPKTPIRSKPSVPVTKKVTINAPEPSGSKLAMKKPTKPTMPLGLKGKTITKKTVHKTTPRPSYQRKLGSVDAIPFNMKSEESNENAKPDTNNNGSVPPQSPHRGWLQEFAKRHNSPSKTPSNSGAGARTPGRSTAVPTSLALTPKARTGKKPAFDLKASLAKGNPNVKNTGSTLKHLFSANTSATTTPKKVTACNAKASKTSLKTASTKISNTPNRRSNYLKANKDKRQADFASSRSIAN